MNIYQYKYITLYNNKYQLPLIYNKYMNNIYTTNITHTTKESKKKHIHRLPAEHTLVGLLHREILRRDFIQDATIFGIQGYHRRGRPQKKT